MSPWPALGAAAMAAVAAFGLCCAVFVGASSAPEASRAYAVPAPTAQPVGAVEHR